MKKTPAKKTAIADEELELVLSEIIRGSGSPVARMQAVRELRALRARQRQEEDDAAAADDGFADLDDDLAPRRAARRSG